MKIQTRSLCYMAEVQRNSIRGLRKLLITVSGTPSNGAAIANVLKGL